MADRLRSYFSILPLLGGGKVGHFCYWKPFLQLVQFTAVQPWVLTRLLWQMARSNPISIRCVFITQRSDSPGFKLNKTKEEFLAIKSVCYARSKFSGEFSPDPDGSGFPLAESLQTAVIREPLYQHSWYSRFHDTSSTVPFSNTWFDHVRQITWIIYSPHCHDDRSGELLLKTSCWRDQIEAGRQCGAWNCSPIFANFKWKSIVMKSHQHFSLTLYSNSSSKRFVNWQCLLTSLGFTKMGS